MNTTNETSLTKAAGPVSVFIASTLDTSTGSVAFDGLQEEIMAPLPLPQDVGLQSPITAAATDRYVASEPQPVDWFKVALQDAHAAGFITSEGLKRVQTALYGRDGACE